MHPIARRLVEHHRMSPLPVEATWFVSTYRSPAELADGAPVGTAMLGLYAAATEPGEVVDPSSYYFRTHLRYHTSSARWARLNGVIGLSTGERRASDVAIHMFEVL